jgi:hypothetical protein
LGRIWAGTSFLPPRHLLLFGLRYFVSPELDELCAAIFTPIPDSPSQHSLHQHPLCSLSQAPGARCSLAPLLTANHGASPAPISRGTTHGSTATRPMAAHGYAYAHCRMRRGLRRREADRLYWKTSSPANELDSEEYVRSALCLRNPSVIQSL